MNRNAQRFFLTAFIAAAGGVLSAAFGPVFAQAIAPEASRGAPQDWSHKHLLHTNPDTRDEAARKGTLAFERWKEKNKDPRFALQVARKTRFVEATKQSPFSPRELEWADRHRRDRPPAGPAIHRDWSNVLGGAAGVGKANVFPAKFQFDINAAPSCANDFVVYTTTSAGATSAGTFAYQTGTFTGDPVAGETLTIDHIGSPTLTITASDTSNLGLNFQIVPADPVATATNLANAMARNGGTVGVTASSAGADVTGTALTAGAIAADYTLTNNLTGFAWTTGADGSGTSGQPTILAFNQLYSSCGTTPTQPVPATFWSYNTGNGATAATSPVLSIDGIQVAFVQRSAANVANLVLLKWSSASPGTVGAPTAPASATLANYRACAAPCMTVIPFTGSPNNTNSSPYVDYTNDILYVGADNGTLHKFTGVFNGTPAETGSPWPVAASAATNILSSPVYDSVSNLVFVGSTSGTNAIGGGQLHSVNAASGALVSSGRLAKNSSSGVRDAPIVDSDAQRVYAFVGSDRSGTSASCSRSPCAAVYQFPTTFAAGSMGTKVQVGRGYTSTTIRFLYAGAFDNAYYTSATPATPSGNLYVCGGVAASGTYPTLWKVPINNNAMGTPIVGPRLVGNTFADCSAITEVMNGANDYIYASVTAGGNDTGCSGACIYMYNLTGLTWAPAAVANAGLAAPGGTSGIVIDNISTTLGASQIYYSTLTSPGNAVQASQAALQ